MILDLSFYVVKNAILGGSIQEDIHRAYKGNLSVRAQVETKDEFGQLSLQFNQMIGRIEELIVQLGSWLPFQDAE